MKKIVLIYLLAVGAAQAQELNCTVTVNTSMLERGVTADQQVFVDLRKAIEEFMNNRRWTTDNFTTEERIKCNLNVNLLKSYDQFAYAASIQFQVFRPVYGTSYESLIFNHIDNNFSFSFRNEDRNMLFNENTYQNALTSTLAFYALTAVGLDYDTFGRLGGTPHLQKAVNVVNVEMGALSMSKKDVCDGKLIRSRYCLAENLSSPQLQQFREAIYNYHRQGLDQVSTQAFQMPKIAFDLLETIKKLTTNRVSVGILDSFMDAKTEEFISVFSDSAVDEKQKAFRLLSEIDPGKTEKYRKLVSN